ncbi:histidinol-phosphatase [Jannaschia sp. EhC01]|nr:histidinol-phosphatase [Jannaschia sp. EhC01]
MADQEALMETAHAMADAARAAILPHFRRGGLGTISKEVDSYDPVTVADRAAEAAMRAVLAEQRPDDAILGEEEGTKEGTSGLTWVLDPIDGTRGFISGTPTWGVLIALCDASGPIYAIIDQPYIGERFEGGFGRALVAGPLGEAALGVEPAATLAEATLFTTFPEVGSLAERRAFDAVRDRVQLTRYGCDCYAYAMLAAGQIDLVIEAGLQSYDIAAPVALIQAAGGVITNWEGGPVHGGGRVIAASSSALHAEAMALVKGALNV